MRVIVCGSRSLYERNDLRKKFEKFMDGLELKEIPAGETLTVVHGDCPDSPDKWASSFCRDWVVTEEAYPADWKKFGRIGGKLRNIEMAEAGADLCIAVWDGESRGTMHMIETAVEYGINVYIISGYIRTDGD